MKKPTVLISCILMAALTILTGCPHPNSPTMYTISYVTAYGTAPASKTVDAGYKLTKEDLPFLGKDNTSGQLFAAWNKKVGDEITGDITLTANWQDEVYLSLEKLQNIDHYYEATAIKFQKEAYDGGEMIQIPDYSGEHEDFYTAHYISATNELIISGNGKYIIFAPTTGGFYNESVTSITFDDCITSYCEDMNRMFFSCSSLVNLDLSNFDTKNVTSMESMFSSCKSLESVNVSSFNTYKVENMSHMFASCTKLDSLDITNFNTEHVTTLSWMFRECNSIALLDLSSFKTSEVKSIGLMFENCNNLKTILVSNSFTLENRNQGEYSDYTKKMFFGCTNLVGGNGTTFSADHTGPDYARIDAPGTPGYFTLKQ